MPQPQRDSRHVGGARRSSEAPLLWRAEVVCGEGNGFMIPGRYVGRFVC